MPGLPVRSAAATLRRFSCLTNRPTTSISISIAAIEAALADFDGALLVASHDVDFLAAIGIERRLVFPLRQPMTIAPAVLAWYDRHARRLPWRVAPQERARGVTPDPYRVWLSEIMLQQTTVAAVKPYFDAFLARWPDVAALAAAPREEVLKAWAGLGYYARARNLHACAEAIVRDHGGRFPATAAGLKALPGIGDYTAAAIAAIACDEAVAVVDGNIERVVARLFAIDTPLPAAKKAIRARQQEMTPAERAGDYAQAMMDLGAALCTPKRPACGLCPLVGACVAHARGTPERYPVKADKAVRPTRHGAAFVAVRDDGAVLLRRRPDRGLLGGMTEVPGSDWTNRASDLDPAAHAPIQADWRRLSAAVVHVFTHFRLELNVYCTRVGAMEQAPPGCWWAPAETLAGEALPSVMKKVIEAALPGATRRQQDGRAAVNDIRHIVFDIGRVLLEWDAEIPYRRLIPDEAERKYFLANICTHDWNIEQDRGRTWREAEDLLIAQYPQHEALIRAFRRNWIEMVPRHFPDTLEIRDALMAQGYDVTALTNFAADTFDEARRVYPFLDQFRGITVSADIGLMKPELAIYRHHAKTFGLDPAATLFFDDNLDNVKGARAAGWSAEQFTGAPQMRADLARHGVALD